jgi:D-alanyl-D-alanine carboxypeptidase
MTNPVAHQDRVPCRLPCWVRQIACLTVLTALAACGSSRPAYHARVQYNPSRYYPPPGPSSDPWGPYIHEASGRFGIPEQWIRSVMRQESGGQEDVISWAGAMGLMQVMPDTYDGLRSRYSLGDDPFDPHNNILAGTAYLREMYDRFGSPGFLAAYNAGPNRLDLYLNSGRPLPTETVNYVASIAPRLGPGTPMSGPLAVYAGPTVQMAAQSTSSGCDPDAAYNPNGPCTPLRPAELQPVAVASAAPAAVFAASYRQAACDPDAAYDPTHPCQPLPAAQAAAPEPAYGRSYAAPAYAGPSYPTAPSYPQGDCDPDAAYDPSRPCQPLPAASAPVVAQSLPPPVQPATPVRRTDYALARPTFQAQPLEDRRPLQERTDQARAIRDRTIQARLAQTVAFAAGPPQGRWAIQVGAFANLATAQEAAERARSALPDILRTAKVELPATTPFGSQVAFRARLFGLSQSAAADACAGLTGRGMACMTVPPTRDSF